MAQFQKEMDDSLKEMEKTRLAYEPVIDTKEQEELDKIVSQCAEITKKFRALLKPAMDEHGSPRLMREVDFLGNTTGKHIELLEVTGEQVKE